MKTEFLRAALLSWMQPAKPERRKRYSWGIGLARGIAAFFGVFSLINLAGSLWNPWFDASHWWIRFDVWPPFAKRLLLLSSAVFLTCFACKPRMSRWRRQVTLVLTTILILTTIVNGATFLALASRSVIHPLIWFPLSLLIALAFGVVLRTITTQSPDNQRMGPWTSAAAALTCALVFPAMHMVFFGKTDYRRQADAAVVFGCRAYADGRPSDALADRVRTACQLYANGTVRKLIFSGGPGDGSVHETESMRRTAVALGVREQDIVIDHKGLSTQATVENTIPMFRQHGFRRVLAVSHFFHLPRIKMAYQRQGVEVYTVPAKESYILRQMPFLVARETAAWWVYYIRPVILLSSRDNHA